MPQFTPPTLLFSPMIILCKVDTLWFAKVGSGAPGIYTDTKVRALEIIAKNFFLTAPTLSAENFLCAKHLAA